MKVLYEDKHILVCEKPAGIATQSGKVTEKDMVSEVNNYLRRADAKASAYLIHRLDKPVRGILLFAKTKQAAAELNRQLQGGMFNKLYHASVEGKMPEKKGVLENYMYKDSKLSKAVIIDEDKAKKPDSEDTADTSDNRRKQKGNSNSDKADIKRAVLEYQVISEIENEDGTVSELEVHLLTGRFHQIRCQLSYIGHPITGDSLYGSSMKCIRRNAIGLTAYRLSFIHPVTKKEMDFII